MIEKDLEYFKKKLLEEKKNLIQQLEYFNSTHMNHDQRDLSGEFSSYPMHMADLGTDAMEREKAFQFLAQKKQYLNRIDEALERIYNGTYGICVECNEEIGWQRLDAMPFTRLCFNCKSKEDKGRKLESLIS